jgi:hypothetical protein
MEGYEFQRKWIQNQQNTFDLADLAMEHRLKNVLLRCGSMVDVHARCVTIPLWLISVSKQ